MANRKILLGLTTITEGGWKEKIKEIDELGLKEIALFPTTLDSVERQELYRSLEKTKIKRIPFVHLRDDMQLEELDYLSEKYGAEIFSVHSENDYFPCPLDYKKYYKKIFVENTDVNTPTENDFKRFAGLCIDFAHWQSSVISEGENGPTDQKIKAFAKKYKIGINHVGCITKEKNVYHDKRLNIDFIGYDNHFLKDPTELDYLKRYKDYLADFICIELENSLKRQMEVKKYLEEILDL